MKLNCAVRYTIKNPDFLCDLVVAPFRMICYLPQCRFSMSSPCVIVYNLAARTLRFTCLYCDIWVSRKSSLTSRSCRDLLVVCRYNCLFSRAILSGKNSTVWAAVWVAREGLKKASGRFSDCHLDISAHLNIAKYLNIAGRIFESVKLSMKDRSWKASERRCREVLGGSLFLVFRPGLVLWKNDISDWLYEGISLLFILRENFRVASGAPSQSSASL